MDGQRRKQILIKFAHGLGDAAQFTAVLRHLAKHRPGWDIDILSRRGKHSAFFGLCRSSFHDQEARPAISYDEEFNLGWWENYNGYADRPNSKITNCLKEVFGIDWEPDLGAYSVRVSHAAREKARRWLAERFACDTAGLFDAVVLHYEGNTSTSRKNLDHSTASTFCMGALARKLGVVLLDWDDRSDLAGLLGVLPHVWRPHTGPGDLWGDFGSGDAEMIAALISQCRLFMGIDSGPGKVASATATPTVICWTGHHPLQFHDPAPNTFHLVPADHAAMSPIHGDRTRAQFFSLRYRYHTYAPGELAEHMLNRLPSVGCRADQQRLGAFLVPATHPEQSEVILRDVYWLDAYRVADLTEHEGPERVLDAGANVGAFACRFAARNPEAAIVCVEANKGLLPCLAKNTSSLAGPWAHVIHAALVGEVEQAAEPRRFLLDSLGAQGESTGGSRVVTLAEQEACDDPRFLKPPECVGTLTVRDVMASHGWRSLHVLKLDIEGSELGVLRTLDLACVRTILVESHDPLAFGKLLAARFDGWKIVRLGAAQGEGNAACQAWRLENPDWKDQE